MRILDKILAIVQARLVAARAVIADYEAKKAEQSAAEPTPSETA